MDVYPSRRTVWFGAVFIPLLGLGAAVWLAADIVRGLRWSDWKPAFAVAVFSIGTRALIHQLRHPRAALHLDENGLEGDFGREEWANVSRIRFRWRWLGRTVVQRVVLDLRTPDPDPPRPSKDYVSRFVYGVANNYGHRIELPLWGPKRRVVADLQRFYDGLVEA